METRRWRFYLVVIIYTIVPHFEAKSVSLNKLIAAETQQKQELIDSTTSIEDITDERFPINQVPPTPSVVTSRKSKGAVNSLLDKKIPLLKYRKAYEIKSPLKPKKIKRVLNPRHKRKNKSIKRDIHEYGKFNQKYIPLLKSVGMLFDNLLDPDTSDTSETRRSKYKNDRNNERKRVVCSCALRPESELETDSNEKTITSTSTVTPEVSTIPEDFALVETTTAPTDHTASSYVSSVRQNKDVPILLPRNTFGCRRNDNGHCEGGGAAHNGDTEGNISRDYGDGEYFTSVGENGADTGSYEENPSGDPRDDASSNGPRGVRGSRYVSTSRRNRNSADEEEDSTERQNYNEPIGLTRPLELKRENKQQVRGNQAKSTKLVSELIRRLRGSLSQNEIGNISKPLQSEENYEEGDIDDTHLHTSSERFPERDGTDTADDQKACKRYEELISIKDLNNSDLPSTTSTTEKKAPIIMIIDGYSVTRDKNGENKISEKSVRLQT